MDTIYRKIVELVPNFSRLDLQNLNDLQKQNANKIYSRLLNHDNHDKKAIRQEYKIIRNNLAGDLRKQHSHFITKKIFDLETYKTAKTVFCFVSFGSEFDTSELISNALHDGKRVCVPLTETNHVMYANEIDENTEYILDKYGIKEPTTRRIVEKSDIDLIIVPGLVFDYLGFRVGYGGGYYDRFLSDFNGTSVGVVFSECISDNIIPDQYDIPVDLVITN